MADIVILAAAGMGAVDKSFAKPLFMTLENSLGQDWSRLYCATLPCLGHFQGNIERTFEGMQKQDMDFLRARKFLLFAMAQNAAQLGDIERRDGNYEKTQREIYTALAGAANATDDKTPVILITHSVGCLNLSNYLWDAQRPNTSYGIWRDGGPAGVHKGSARERFLRLKTLRHWYTLGATTPLWSAGRTREQIQAVTPDTRGYSFRWKNFYHPNDLFGWPLKPLSSSYNQAVYRDYETRPLSDHCDSNTGASLLPPEDYWQSELVTGQLLEDVRALLKGVNKSSHARTQRSRPAVAV
ncbi:hypothetical protein MO867_09815 [Microbulbifer sp. OS29]|uniref:Uncharacterized protein n=1 Tax=Microbulbifer okhotskensis TaxID=2926617 RepID=A0A9X2J6H8_9GAMM|nr:hypothetical protein [Microbulbifer okhotskensis]MCO1334635.1 hypothetical protein [Microbulbifer okhotskensis]